MKKEKILYWFGVYRARVYQPENRVQIGKETFKMYNEILINRSFFTGAILNERFDTHKRKLYLQLALVMWSTSLGKRASKKDFC